MQSNQYGSPCRASSPPPALSIQTAPQSYFPCVEGQSGLNAPPPPYNPDSPRPPSPAPPQYHEVPQSGPGTQTVPVTAPQYNQMVQMNPAPQQIPLSANPTNQYAYAPVPVQQQQFPQPQSVGYSTYPQVQGNPSNPVMVVVHQQHQPVPQSNGPRTWKYGLCNCLEDCSACCLSLCCPCIAAGEIWSKALDKGLSSGVGFWSLLVYVPALIFYLLEGYWNELLFVAIFHPIWWSIPLRQKRGIAGNYINDFCCLLWCQWCRLTQELREARDIAIEREVELRTKAAPTAQVPVAPVMYQAAPAMHQAVPVGYQATPVVQPASVGYQAAPVVQYQ